MENYHLDDLTDNAYTKMIGQIRQFIADLPDEIVNEDDITATLKLYSDEFDVPAYKFFEKCLFEELEN